jgi:hypothetical protein
VLLREDCISADEIKSIFGPIWASKNRVRRRVRKVLMREPRLQRRMGELIYKGHASHDLMLNLQLGIRYSAGGWRCVLCCGGVG